MFKSHSEKQVIKNNIFAPEEKEEKEQVYEGEEFEEDEEAFKAALEKEAQKVQQDWNKEDAFDKDEMDEEIEEEYEM